MKIQNLLISQPKPVGDKSPYFDLAEKHKLKIDFRQFIKVISVDLKEYKSQHINLQDYTAVVFTSKQGIDSFFNIAEQIKYKVPETQLYYCSTEAIALYLQKYTLYRKRKIFHGKLKISELKEQILKHKTENFLIAASDITNNENSDFLNSLGVKNNKIILYKTVSADLSDIKDEFNKYDMLCFFSPAGIKSLKENFPDFTQGEVKICAFGTTTHQAVEELGYRLDVKVPSQEYKSMDSAIDHFVSQYNKKKK